MATTLASSSSNQGNTNLHTKSGYTIRRHGSANSSIRSDQNYIRYQCRKRLERE